MRLLINFDPITLNLQCFSSQITYSERIVNYNKHLTFRIRRSALVSDCQIFLAFQVTEDDHSFQNTLKPQFFFKIDIGPSQRR